MCPSEQRICGKTREEFFEAIQSFHGFTAPGLVLGSFMVDLARSLIGEDVEADAIVETRHCLPDAARSILRGRDRCAGPAREKAIMKSVLKGRMTKL